VIDRRLD
jgi:hypothetical protein